MPYFWPIVLFDINVTFNDSWRSLVPFLLGWVSTNNTRMYAYVQLVIEKLKSWEISKACLRNSKSSYVTETSTSAKKIRLQMGV